MNLTASLYVVIPTESPKVRVGVVGDVTYMVHTGAVLTALPADRADTIVTVNDPLAGLFPITRYSVQLRPPRRGPR